MNPEEQQEQQGAPQANAGSENIDTSFDDLVRSAVSYNKPADKPAEEKPAENQGTENATQTTEQAATTENKPEGEQKPAEGEKKDDANSAPAGEKKEGEEEKQAPLIEFSLADLNKTGIDAGKEAPKEGSWVFLAQKKGLEIKEDTLEAFEEALTAPLKADAENARALSLEKVYAQLNPEVAARLKMLDQGMTEEQIFEPTREIQQHLKRDDADLVRANYEAKGYKPEQVERLMEQLTLEPQKLKIDADIIRTELTEVQNKILQHHKNTVQQFEVKHQQAVEAQKELKANQFKQAMDTVSQFIGAPLPTDLKDELITRYKRGEYQTLFDDPKNEVELVLWKTLGQKAVGILQNTAFEKGRDGLRTKLSNIPPVKETNAGSTQKPMTSNQQWGAAAKLAQEIGGS